MSKVNSRVFEEEKLCCWDTIDNAMRAGDTVIYLFIRCMSF